MLTKQREIILIFGKTGSGKSFHAKKIIQNYERVIVIDTQYEYEGLVFTSYKDLNEWMKDNSDNSSFFCVCRFTNDIDYDYLFEMVYVIGNLLLVVEEAEIYISPYSKRSKFNYLVRYGRHKDVSILGIARRASELSVDFRAQVNKIISFKQTEPNDLRIMEGLGLRDLDKLNQYEYSEIEP